MRRPVPGADFLTLRVAEDLGERLAAVARRFGTAVVLGDPTGHAAAMVDRSGRADRVIRAVPPIAGIDWGSAEHGLDPAPGVVADEEALPFAEGSLDLVVAPLSLHAVNDLPGALVQIRRALAPDGLMLAAVLGGDTLTELRQSFLTAEAELTGGASPRVSPFVDVRDMGGLLQRAGLALPVTDVDRLTVRYDDMFALVRDLRALGATNVLADRSRRPIGRGVVLRAAAIYAERFADPDGRVRATFDVISASGWGPADSQQKPLRPGSAKTRLADALGTREQSAGEKPG